MALQQILIPFDDSGGVSSDYVKKVLNKTIEILGDKLTSKNSSGERGNLRVYSSTNVARIDSSNSDEQVYFNNIQISSNKYNSGNCAFATSIATTEKGNFIITYDLEIPFFCLCSNSPIQEFQTHIGRRLVAYFYKDFLFVTNGSSESSSCKYNEPDCLNYNIALDDVVNFYNCSPHPITSDNQIQLCPAYSRYKGNFPNLYFSMFGYSDAGTVIYDINNTAFLCLGGYHFLKLDDTLHL